MSDESNMCYAARTPGAPGYCAVAADDPRWAKDTAKTIAGWIRDGRTIERVTGEVAKAGLNEYIAACKAAKATPA